MRIISLLPSATEILCELGLEDNIFGVTNECKYPSSINLKEKADSYTHLTLPTICSV